MKNFFLNQNNNFVIELFSIYHLLFICLIIFISVIIISNKNKLLNLKENNKKLIRYSLAIILFINFLLRRGSFIYYGVYDWKIHLDINFCNFTSILLFIYCLTGNKKIYPICFYFAFIGPLLSIILPSSNMSILNYSFYSFIILHHIIFIYNIIFMYINNYKYNKKDLIFVLYFIVIYFTLIYLFNYFMNTRYNMPLTFLNDFILNKSIIVKTLNIKNIEYFIMVSINGILIYIGKSFLKIFNK